MSSQASHPIRNPVVATIIAATIISFITTCVPGGWLWVGGKLGVFFQWLTGSAKVPIWLLILLVVLFLIVTAIAVRLALETALISGDESRVTNGIFYDIRWRWKNGMHGICDLAPFCPKCDLQIIPKAFGINGPIEFICEECGSVFDVIDECSHCGILKKRKTKVGSIKHYKINFYGICKNCK